MTTYEIYSGLYLAKNKIQDILFLEVCSRIGAPGVDVSFFTDHEMTPEGAAQLRRVERYLIGQLQQAFLESLSTVPGTVVDGAIANGK